jgi:hypothetical protein
VGVNSGATPITLTVPANTTGIDVTAQITSAPATSVNAGLGWSAGTSAAGTFSDVASKTASAQSAGIDANGVAFATGITASAKATTSVTAVISPDVAGTYTVLVTVGGAAASGWSAGLKSTSYTVTTAGSPTAMTLTAINSTTFDADSNGSLIKVSMKDALGAATTVGACE